MTTPVAFWIAFITFLLAMLALDLGVFHRRAHLIGLAEALKWSAMWVFLALLFDGIVYFWRGPERALEFLTGYLIELSLSMDNLFVFLLIFTYFRVPRVHQHRVLFWGILGALTMRGIFIGAGVTLVQKFHWVIYIFGAFLIVTGIRMAFERDKEIHPERNPVLRLFRRFMPVTDRYEDGRFFAKRNGRYFATPLLVVLLVLETTDVIFATDSVPAILAITLDPFVVYTSNAFAILGLRSLFFALAGLMRAFHYLHYGLSAVLVFIGAKMLLGYIYHIPVGVALGVVVCILLLSVAASIVRPSAVQTISGASDPPARESSAGQRGSE